MTSAAKVVASALLARSRVAATDARSCSSAARCCSVTAGAAGAAGALVSRLAELPVDET